jgi:hypothetical protein
MFEPFMLLIPVSEEGVVVLTVSLASLVTESPSVVVEVDSLLQEVSIKVKAETKIKSFFILKLFYYKAVKIVPRAFLKALSILIIK